jgi:CheY-like chemotaxis protein
MSAIAGRRVLVLEDEAVLAFALEDMLIELGCEVVGPALRLAEASRLAENERLDAAVLDVNIGGDRSYSVAEVLERRGIPFMFATGYGSCGVDLKRSGTPVLAKPYRQHELETELTRLVQRPSSRG